MKKIILPILLSALAHFTLAQEISENLNSFTRVIASPHVNLILKKGDQESIRLVYQNVNSQKINIEVHHKTLKIFLDEAQHVEKRHDHQNGYGHKSGIYKDVHITAYVTYKTLTHLEIRGNQELSCLDPVEADEFTLKAYGENTITLASLKTKYFKTSLYGENKLRIKNGKVLEQRYKLYGENKINTSELKSSYTSTSIFGEGDLTVNSSREIRVSAFGEPTIHVKGGGHIKSNLVFGNASITQDK